MPPINKLLISVDVEEFDLPEEYGLNIPTTEKFVMTEIGLHHTLELFYRYRIKATFFITANWAQRFPELTREIASVHEIASHSYYHGTFDVNDMRDSKMILEDICGQEVLGFRMPRLEPVDYHELKLAGFRYDTSLNPTWLPGRYNNWNKPRTPFKKDGIWVIPSAVSPGCRYPVFWLSVKNAPLLVSQYFSKRILTKDGMLSFYFHPWELVSLQYYKLPIYIKFFSGQKMKRKLSAFFNFLDQQGAFFTYRQLLQELE